MKLGAVVPAAGLSRRMGREKLLLSFGSSTVLERVLSTLSAAGVHERVVVLRQGLSEALAIVKRTGSRAVVNPHPEEEMLDSIRLGIAELSPDVEAFFVWPADHPAVRSETLMELAALAAPRRVAVPVYAGRRGHPALVGGGLFNEILRIPPGEGLRYLWRAAPEILLELPVEDRGVLLDLNTPEDLETLRLLQE